MTTGKAKITVRETALMGAMTALLVLSVHIMAPLPNVEPVTLLIILYTLFLGGKVAYILAAYLLIEGCFYGFGIWWMMYVYLWPLLSLLTFLFRRKEGILFWSLFSGAFGLFFGALCSLAYLFVGGPGTAFAWWVAGIPYDLIHCAANFVLCMALFRPMNRLLKKFRLWLS